MVEGAALEKRCGRKAIVSSNLTPSAKIYFWCGMILFFSWKAKVVFRKIISTEKEVANVGFHY